MRRYAFYIGTGLFIVLLVLLLFLPPKKVQVIKKVPVIKKVMITPSPTITPALRPFFAPTREAGSSAAPTPIVVHDTSRETKESTTKESTTQPAPQAPTPNPTPTPNNPLLICVGPLCL